MSEILGEAQIIIRANTAPFLAQLEEMRALAAKPIVAPVSLVATGVGTATLARTSATTAIKAETVATQELAGAQAVTAIQTRQGAAAAAASARAHAQLARGAEATSLSLLGIRGATLAASSSFLAGAAAVTIAAKSIGAASDRTEQLNKSVEVFAGSAGGIKQWSQTTATALGISETAALSASSTFGQLFRTLGVGPARAAQLSETLVKLASDLASFNNVSPERALAAIQSGLVGQARPLRTLGVFLTETRVKQEALAETNKRSASELTQQDRILARYALILRDASLATGDFQRTQGRLANQSRILKANFADLEANIGTALLPALTEIVIGANKAFEAMSKLSGVKIGPPGFSASVKDVIRWGGGWGEASFLLDKAGLSSHKTADETSRLADVVKQGNKALSDMADFLDNVFTHASALQSRLKDVTSSISGLQVQQLKIQTGLTPGGGAAELANLRQQEAAAKRQVALAASGSKARRDALQQLKSIQDQITSLENGFAQDAKDAAQKQADAAKSAATAVKNAQSERDQAFLDILGGRQQTIENRLLVAQGTQALSDDVNVEKALIRFFNDSLARIRRAAASGKISASAAHDAIQQIITERIQARNDLKQLTQQQAQDALDQRQQILQLNIQIAQTTGNVSAQERADKAYITFLDKQIKAAKGNRLKIKQLRLERAQTEADLKSLTQQTNKNTDAAKGLKQAEFNFLQTQTGFVSNLLGNLIPGGATAGLVGGGGGPSVPSNVRPTGQLSAAQTTSQANLVRPFTSGQGETQTNILRHILAELHRLNTGNEHPEAHKQRRTGAAVMDFQSATPGF